MTNTIKVVLIEDNPGDRRLVEEVLMSSENNHYEISSAETLGAGINLLNKKQPDIVLLDLDLPDSFGLDTVQTLQKHNQGSPVIVLTGLNDRETAIKVIQKNAEDYVCKSYEEYKFLPRIISFAIERSKIKQKIKFNEKNLQNMIDNSPDGIVVIDYEGVIRYLNTLAMELLNLGNNSIGETFWGSTINLHENDEIKTLKTDGSSAVVHILKSQIEWEEQSGFIYTVRDITKKKELEKLKELSSRILKELTSKKNISDMTEDILSIIKETLKIQSASFELIEEEGYSYTDDLRSSADSTGIESQVFSVDKKGPVEIDLGEYPFSPYIKHENRGNLASSLKKHFKNEKSFWSNSATQSLASLPENKYHKEIFSSCISGKYESVAIIPIKSENHTIGVLQLCDTRTNRFKKETIRQLEEIALSIGIAFEKKQLRDDLKNALERFDGLFHSSSDAIVFFNENGNLLEANHSFCKLSGFNLDEISGKHYSGFLQMRFLKTAPESIHNLDDRCFETEFETEFERKDRSKVLVSQKLFKVKGKDKNVIGIAAIIKDITEIKKLEEDKDILHKQFLQSQKMEAVGRLAGGLAHDFNNMLTVMMGNSEMILMKMDEEHPFYPDIQQVVDAAERAKELTMKLLTFSRKEKLSLSRVSTDNLLDDVIRMLQRTIIKKINIKKIIDDDPFVFIDKNQIQQALMNIGINACDAMPDGGDLLFVSQVVHLDEDTIVGQSNIAPGEYLNLSISDTGIGIPEKLIDKVFEPFFTSKGIGTGTGLGLSTALGIIQNHNGHINISSTPGVGTTIGILLPIAERETVSDENQKHGDTPTGTETLLIIDDEESVLDITSRLLGNFGYKTIVAKTGMDGIRIFENINEDISLVILDMIMPEMDGLDVFRKLKEIDPEIKIILSSGYSNDKKSEMIIKEGIDGFVQKPFNVSSLCTTVRSVLDNKMPVKINSH